MKSKRKESLAVGNAFTLQLGTWLLMLTISLLFAALTAAFVQSRVPSSFNVDIPIAFFVSTLVLIGSSFLLHWGWTRGEPMAYGAMACRWLWSWAYASSSFRPLAGINYTNYPFHKMKA